MSQIYNFFSILRIPIAWCLQTLAQLFGNVPILVTIGAFGLAIVVTTLILRALLFPLFGWQLRTQRRIQAEQRVIAPQLQELRKRYKREPQKLSEEMKKVYAEHNMSPFSSLSGCLPTLVQFPVLIGLYRGIFDSISHVTTSPHFLWIPDVTKSVHDACCTQSWGNLLTNPSLAIIPLLAAAATYMQSRMMMPPMRDNMSDQERSMVSVSKNMSYIFPVMIFVMSVSFAQGLAIYWVTGTMFMVAQQYHLVGWGSLHVPSWLPGAHRTTPLSHPKPGAAPAIAPVRASRAVVASDPGGNGSAVRVAREPSRPAAPGRGRAPQRSQKKPKRRR